MEKKGLGEKKQEDPYKSKTFLARGRGMASCRKGSTNKSARGAETPEAGRNTCYVLQVRTETP